MSDASPKQQDRFKYRRAFVEITNACNLRCSFCAASERKAVFMPVKDFANIANELKELTSMLSLHVLGEPMMHPDFPEILAICSNSGLGVNLVTNGTLLNRFGMEPLREKCLRQISFSLHALSALGQSERKEKLHEIMEFAKSKPERLIISLRLRSSETDEFTADLSKEILKSFSSSGEYTPEQCSITLAENIYLNSGRIFEWPGGSRPVERKSCLGLRHHFAVLSGGEVTPCCADYDGRMAFGSIYKDSLKDILSGKKAEALRGKISGMSKMPEYCSTCGFSAPD